MKEKTISIKLTKDELLELTNVIDCCDEINEALSSALDKLFSAQYEYTRKYNEPMDIYKWWR